MPTDETPAAAPVELSTEAAPEAEQTEPAEEPEAPAADTPSPDAQPDPVPSEVTPEVTAEPAPEVEAYDPAPVFQQGEMARELGLDESACPYVLGEKREHWLAGHKGE